MKCLLILNTVVIVILLMTAMSRAGTFRPSGQERNDLNDIEISRPTQRATSIV